MAASASMHFWLVAGWLLILSASALATGFLIVGSLLRHQPRPVAELLGLSLGIGLGAIGLLEFWFALLGFERADRIVQGVGVISATLIFAFRRFLFAKEARSFSLGKVSAIDAALLLLCGAAGLLVFVNAVIWPFEEWDSVFIWGLKGRFLAEASIVPKPWTLTDTSLSYSHLDYPLLLPFLYAAGYDFAGGFVDTCAKVVLPLIFVSFLLLFYSAVRWKASRTFSLALTALIATLPSLLRWADTGNADMALTVFYTAAIIYYLRWIEDEKNSDLIFAALFSVFCALTKSEGMALLVINFGLVSFASIKVRRNWKPLLFSLFGISLLLLPWIAWAADIPRTHEDYAGKLNMAWENAGRLKIILPQFFKEFTNWQNWGCLWFTLSIAPVIFWRNLGRKHVWCLWLFMFAHLALYVFVFVITPWKLEELFVAALERLVLHVAPVAALLIGFQCAPSKSAAPGWEGELSENSELFERKKRGQQQRFNQAEAGHRERKDCPRS